MFLSILGATFAASSLVYAQTFVPETGETKIAIKGVSGLSEQSVFVYGHPEFGYFLARRPKKIPGGIELTLYAPFFRLPLNVYSLADDKLKFLKSFRLKPPPKLSRLQPKAETQGHLTPPFFGQSWVRGGPNLRKIRSSAVVFNRFGELVRAHPVFFDGVQTRLPPIASPLESGGFAILARRKPSGFQLMDERGRTIREYRPAKGTEFHHALQYLPATGEFLSFAYDCRQIESHDEFVPFLKGFASLFRRWRMPARTYAGSKLVRVNLATGQERIVWSSFDSFSPGSDRSLSLYVGGIDRFIDVETEEQYKQFLNSPYLAQKADGLRCDVDWTHENSVHYKEGLGYLISIRNLNRLALIGEDGHLVWSIGESHRATINLPLDGSAFSMQHDARWLSDGRILLFDNSTNYRGATGRRRLNRIQILKTDGRSATVEWSFELPFPPSEIRGSVTPLVNENFLAYLPGEWGHPYRLVEVSPKKEVIGTLTLKRLGDVYRSVESRPVYSLNGDPYMPPDRVGPEMKLDRSGVDELLSDPEGY